MLETTKERLAQIRQVEARLKEEAEGGPLSARPGQKVARRHRTTGRKTTGRPKQAGSSTAVADATGVPRATRHRMEEHERLAEQFPFMKDDSMDRDEALQQAARWVLPGWNRALSRPAPSWLTDLKVVRLARTAAVLGDVLQEIAEGRPCARGRAELRGFVEECLEGLVGVHAP